MLPSGAASGCLCAFVFGTCDSPGAMAVLTDALHGALLEEAASLATKAGRQTEAHQKLSLLMDFVSDVMVHHPASIHCR